MSSSDDEARQLLAGARSAVTRNSLEDFLRRGDARAAAAHRLPAPVAAAPEPAAPAKAPRRKVSKEEDEFEARLCEHGSGLGWLMRAVKRSKTPAIVTVPGWPDVEMLHPRHRVFAVAELKTDLKAHATGAQIKVASAFAWAGIRAFLWTPDDWDEIDAFLRDPHRFLRPLPATMAYDTPNPSGGASDGSR